MGEAKQIIFFDEEKKIKYNKVELENILNQKDVKELPIVILSVIGALRTGKSFLLSWLVRYFKTDIKNPEWIKLYENEEKLSQFFKWRSGSTSETQGIWAWSEVFIANGPSGEKVGVLLIDTQGLFHAKNTTKQNGNIFTLSTLMSSIQIFNLRSAMQEDNLEYFQSHDSLLRFMTCKVFSEYGRLVALATNSSVTNPFQRAVFLIRDWPNPKERSFGSHGGKDYIDDYLRVNEKNKGTELGERRQQIRKLFSKADCYLMPKPGEKIETDESDSYSRLSDMNTNFMDHLGELPTFLFPNGEVEQSKLVAGAPVLAGDIAGNVEDYVNLLNSDDNLSPQSMFQVMAKIRNTTLARDAKNEYKAFVNSVEEKMEKMTTFLTDDEIQMKHSEAKKKALDYFEKHQMGDTELNPEILNEFLNNDINDELENWKIRNERAKGKIQLLNEKALEEAIPRYSSSMDEWSRADANHPFVTLEQINQKHMEIQENIAKDLKSHLKGPGEFTNTFVDQLDKYIKDEFVNWKNRNELAKEEIIKFNDTALKEGTLMYTNSMNDWLEGEKPFAIPEKLTNHHQKIFKNVESFLKSQLKGPNGIKEHFLTQFQQYIEDEFKKWKKLNERNQDETLESNKKALEKAKTFYSSSMDDWSKGEIHPFATMEQINQKHTDIQKKSTNELKNILKGPNEFTNHLLIELQQHIDNEFGKWNTRNELAKGEILKSNETALKNGKTFYCSSMNDWAKRATCFATLEQINKKHREIQEKTRNDVKNNLKGPNEITKDALIQLQRQIDGEFQNWKNRYEREKADIMTSNKEALEETKKMYISSMKNWIKGETFFANPEKLAKQNENIQKIVKSHLRNQLKGPDKIPTQFMTQLRRFMQDYFQNKIVPENESKRIASIGLGVACGTAAVVGGTALVVVAAPVALVAGAFTGVTALTVTGITALVKRFGNQDPKESPPNAN